MKKEINSFTDLEHLELVASRIVESGVDITKVYNDWTLIALSCASSLGEEARESFHKICSQYPNYSKEECDDKFDNCLRTGRGDVKLGTLFKIAKDHGIDISLPRGRRPKSEAQRKEECENRFMQMKQIVREWDNFRFNVWKNRVEIDELSQGNWRPIDIVM